MKKARLEIRLDEVDKELLRKMAELEGCTITSLLDDYIQDLIKKLRVHLKPNDSGESLEING